MVIGFTERIQRVSESIGQIGGIFPVSIAVATERMAEREHPMIFRVQLDSSSAVMEPLTGQNNADNDAVFGRRYINDEPLEQEYVLEALVDTIPSLTTYIRNDFRPEDVECFTIEIIPADVPGRRELFYCNENDSVEGNYFCETTICIEDDDSKFV